MRGITAIGALLSLCGLANIAVADIPQVVVPDKGHRYIVWLDPFLSDGTTKPPLTDADITRYCGAAQGFAERMWRVTNGRHKIFQVEFNYGSAPMRYDVWWRRYNATANATLGGGLFRMFDSITLARHTWSEQPLGNADNEQCNAVACVQANCPPGLNFDASTGNAREICVDGAGNSPLESAQDAAETLAHELSHSHYRIDDEYNTSQADPVLYGFRICANPADWGTSIMSTSTDFWCDEHTHLTQRFVGTGVNTPFTGTQTVGGLSAGDSWSEAKAFWADLASYNSGSAVAHVAGSEPSNEHFTDPIEAWAPLPSDEFCVFTGDEFASATLNDVVVVVDKSGSMNYRNTALDVTAFEAAFAAGLGHFNRTAAQRKAGLSVFDDAVDRLIPYQAGASPQPITNFTLAADGLTNLCDAISDTAAQVRAGGTNDTVGHMVLLTDGRPTVAGCNTAEAVRAAAYEACVPSDGSKPVAISTLAFGDADYALIQQISDICAGVARQTNGSMCPPGQTCAPPAGGSNSPPPGAPAPLAIKVAGSRLAYHVRGYGEAMFSEQALPSVFERSFDIPPGTQELEAVWMGEQTSFTPIIIPRITRIPSSPFAAGADGTFCEFEDDYEFELLDPSGNPAGFDVVPASIELGYLTRSRRVNQPAAGRWTMRVRGGEPCVVGGTQPAPEVAMFANYRNSTVQTEVVLEKSVLASNESTRVTALLQIAPDTAATNISVNARLVNGATELSVPMFDDGASGGDEVAADGLYTGRINPGCTPGLLPEGGYRFVVDFASNAATAQPVLLPNADVQVAFNAGAPPQGTPITVSLVDERMLTVLGCNSAVAGCGGAAPSNLCPAETAVVDGDVDIPAGGITPDITVTVRNCPIASTGVTVGVGPGVVTSNVRSSYNDATGIGTVTFDAEADANPLNGVRTLGIFWGRHRCETNDAIVTVSGCEEALPDFDGDGIGDRCDENSLVADAGPDQTLECTGAGRATVILDGSASGAPTGDVTYAWNAPVALEDDDQPIATGSFALGTSTAVLTVTQGNRALSDSTLVSVVDTKGPVLTPPADIVAETCGSVNIGQATAVDTCGGPVTLVNDAPTTFRAGVTLVRWKATDRFGNVSEATQRIAVGIGDNQSCCPAGSRIVLGTSNNDTLNGTSGVDCILARGGQDTVRGMGGGDFLSGGEGDDIIEGGDGNDLLQGGGGQDTLRGQNGNDIVIGSPGVDACFGGANDDLLFGAQGQDRLLGEAGNDQLFGGADDDRLEGGDGNDLLDGGGLHDTCLGGAGSNTLISCETTL